MNKNQPKELSSGNSIINAVKRLERVGSEHSKATEKLFAACTEVAGFLLEHVGEDIPFGMRSARISGPAATHPYRVVYHEPEEFTDYQGYQLEYFGKVIARTGRPQEWDRRTALGFAADLANGLLDEAIAAVEKETERVNAATQIAEAQAAKLNVDPGELTAVLQLALAEVGE
jgi:hypothetical protein